MPEHSEEDLRPHPEDERYCRPLCCGSIVGFVLLAVTYVVYVSGVVPPRIRIADTPKFWGLCVKDYLEKTDLPNGWGWVRMLNQGDMLNFVSIAFLGCVTVPCLLSVVPVSIRRAKEIAEPQEGDGTGDEGMNKPKERPGVFAILLVAEALVLTIAATGWFSGTGR